MTESSTAKSSPIELTRLRERVNAHAATVIEQKFENSSLLKYESNSLPRFSLDEVVRGKYLGKGVFGIVYEVKGLDGRDTKGNIIQYQSKKKWFHRRSSLPEDEDEQEEGDDDGDEEDVLSLDIEDEFLPPSAKIDARKQEASRDFMRRHCRRDNGQMRYAFKILRPELLKQPTKQYFQGIMDLATETRLLSTIQHPHVVKLRAIAHGWCHEEYFLILDRLYEVLEERIKVWGRRYQRNSGFMGRNILDRRGGKRAQLWRERIVAAHDLASALAYLHSRRIIHRDLKGENIGFDIRGDIKIFDFGLARELPPAAHANEDGIWKMTGCTGTPRYMSPEVALDQPYNESSDSYSFSMLLWEILALKTPFELYTMKSFQARVWQAPYKRPPLDPSWPNTLCLLISRGWSPQLVDRQPMNVVAESLRKEVIQCLDDVDDEWGLHVGAERRSTHVFDEKDMRLDLSQKSLLSILSSPFHTKPPSAMSSEVRSPITKVTSSDKEILDVTKVTVEMTLSPSHVDLSEQSNDDEIIPRRVNSLPTKPPLFDASDEWASHRQPESLKDDFAKTSQLHLTEIRDIGSPSTGIWERLDQERERQERLRTRLTNFQ